MLQTLAQGVILGFTVAVMLGPAFFTLIQTSIHRGFKSGVLLALGVFLSDLSLVVLCALGASQIVYEPRQKMILGIVGGVIMIIFGAFTFTRKVHVASDHSKVPIKVPKPFTFIAKGFFLNFANPFIWVFWIGVVGVVSSTYSEGLDKMIVFLVGTLGTILATDVIKSFIANKFKRILKPHFMTWLNRLVGISLIVFGVLLMMRVLFDSVKFINFLY
jgi:threonine/homoserine/homoserine lactone efflux protein